MIIIITHNLSLEEDTINWKTGVLLGMGRGVRLRVTDFLVDAVFEAFDFFFYLVHISQV